MKSDYEQTKATVRFALPTMPFHRLPIGAIFRWQSNLGGQDRMRKISRTTLRNLATGNEYEPSREKHYFGPDDNCLLMGF